MSLSGWDANKIIQCSVAAPASELTDSVVLVNLSSASGVTDFDCAAVFTELGANSKKIAFEIGETGVQCYAEIEQWGADNAQIRVKIPTRLTTAATIIKLYYDSTHADNTTYIGDTGDSPAQAVYDSSFDAVYNMAQDPSTGGACILDSTANANHGTPSGLAADDLVSGLIGMGIDFDGVGEKISSALSNVGTGDFTVFILFKAFNPQVYTYPILFTSESGGTYGTGSLFLADGASSGYMSWTVGSTRIVNAGQSVADATYHTACVKRISGTLSLLLDDTVKGAVSNSSSVDFTSATIGFANYSPSNTSAKVTIDYLSISTAGRSAAWVTSSHLSETDALITYSFVPGVSSGSSGGAAIILPTVRQIVDMPYSIMESIRTIVNLLYGIKLAAIVNLRYGDLTELRKITYLRYGDLALIRRLIDVLYGDLSSYRNLVNIDYDLMSQVRGLVNIPYHILQGEVRNLINLPYDLQLLDIHKNIVDIIYAIASGEAIEEITTLSVVNDDGYELNPFHINIEKDEGDPCIRIEMRSNDENDYVKNPVKKKVTVTVNSDSYVVLVEDVEISTQISEDGQQLDDVYSFKLASPCILLDTPYADLLTEELTGMASFIAEYVAGTVSDFDAYGIEWNLIDWNIGEKIFTVNDTSPISILETLASACGGVLQSKKDGTLELRPEYPTNIPDYATTSPSVFLTDQDNFYSVSSVTERYQGYNNFLVGDVSPDVDGLEIKSETLTTTAKEIRVFQVPFNNDDTIQLKTSGGQHVGINDGGIKLLLINEEEVEIVDGEGSTSFPIYNVVDYDYSETDLGAVTYSEDKTINTSTNGNSIITLSYYTKFRKFIVKDEKIENVQFWPEIV